MEGTFCEILRVIEIEFTLEHPFQRAPFKELAKDGLKGMMG